MKLERTKNATRNFFVGLLFRIYQIIMPFIIRTALIYTLGVEYLGLNSLFTSILQVLNLAELGVGTAMVYSMYKPIADGDKEKICALMGLYRKYYHIIGIIILVAGLGIIPFLKFFVKTDTVPNDINIYILYLINLVSTVTSYWLFAYKNCLFTAFQRNDISFQINIVVLTFGYIMQLAVLIILKNYYIYTIILVIISLTTNIVTAIVADKRYPEYKAKGTVDIKEIKQINKKVKDLFTARLGGTIVGSADTIVISSFLGLSVLAIYQNYYYIMSAVISIIMIMFSSTLAGIGNSLVTESEEKNYGDFRKFAFIISWIAIIAISCFIGLYQPAIELWVGKALMLDYSYVILFCVYFYVFIIQQLACVYKDAGGIWHNDRFRPLVAGIVNLGLNLLLVKWFGLYAIMLSTIISYIFVAIPWLIHNLFSTVFHSGKKEYIVSLLRNSFTAIIVGSIVYFVCQFINGNLIITIIIKLIVCVTVSNLLLVFFYRHENYYNQMLDLFDNMSKKRFHTIVVRFKYMK